MKAQRQLEEAGELSQYGLDAPPFTVTAVAGGETYTFLYGDQNQMTQDRYLMLEGSDAVYTVDEIMYSAFQYAPEDLFEEEEESDSSAASSEAASEEESGVSSESASSEAASSEEASSDADAPSEAASSAASSEAVSSQAASSEAASSDSAN